MSDKIFDQAQETFDMSEQMTEAINAPVVEAKEKKAENPHVFSAPKGSYGYTECSRGTGKTRGRSVWCAIPPKEDAKTFWSPALIDGSETKAYIKAREGAEKLLGTTKFILKQAGGLGVYYDEQDKENYQEVE